MIDTLNWFTDSWPRSVFGIALIIMLGLFTFNILRSWRRIGGHRWQ